MEEERSRARVREDDYHDKIDGLDKEIFTLTECVEVSESHAEELQNELMKERARTGNFCKRTHAIPMQRGMVFTKIIIP